MTSTRITFGADQGVRRATGHNAKLGTRFLVWTGEVIAAAGGLSSTAGTC